MKPGFRDALCVGFNETQHVFLLVFNYGDIIFVLTALQKLFHSRITIRCPSGRLAGQGSSSLLQANADGVHCSL